MRLHLASGGVAVKCLTAGVESIGWSGGFWHFLTAGWPDAGACWPRPYDGRTAELPPAWSSPPQEEPEPLVPVLPGEGLELSLKGRPDLVPAEPQKGVICPGQHL